MTIPTSPTSAIRAWPFCAGGLRPGREDRCQRRGDLLDAALIGFETACRIGTWLGRRHYQHGFHQTATSGTFGAAMAVGAVAERLDQDQRAPRARTRRHQGVRPQVPVRHHGQALPCRDGGGERRRGGIVGRCRLRLPARRPGVRTRLCRHPCRRGAMIRLLCLTASAGTSSSRRCSTSSTPVATAPTPRSKP